MPVFNLRFKTLSGDVYRLPVKSTDSIQNIKDKLIEKIKKANPNFGKTSIRLTYSDGNTAEELMDGKMVSDYPALPTLTTEIALIINAVLSFPISITAPHGIMTIRVIPEDTIVDVKDKIYEELLKEPFYRNDDGTYNAEMWGSGAFGLTMWQDDTSITLRPLRTIKSYSAIQPDTSLEIVWDHEQFIVDIIKKISKYSINTVGDHVPFNYFMTGFQFKHYVATHYDTPATFDLYIAGYGIQGKAVLIEDEVHLYEYRTLVNDITIILVDPNAESNSSSNSNSGYNSWGGKRRTRKRNNKRRNRRLTTHKSHN